jgi:superfamily II DNA or RNA helicase
MPELRPYQRDAVERVRALLRSTRRVVVAAPTGAGKTVFAANVIALAYARGTRVVFFAHRRELIGQTYSKLIDAGIPELDLGVLMAADRRARPAAPIQIASIDTWRHREPPPAQLVIVDEAHRSLSPSYLRAIEHYAGAVVLGLTATPYRADGRGLGDVYQALELVASPRELIDAGYLVEPRVFAGARPDLSGVRVRGGDYVEADLARVMGERRLVGRVVEHWQRLAEGQRTVAFAAGIEHSRSIAEAFRAAGVAAEHLDGTTPTAERDAILARLASGETLIVSNCGVLCEGWDMPAVKCAILARPTKSTGLYLQQAGRILRPWEGVRALILDHAGNALVHGLPQDDRAFSLAGRERDANAHEAPTKTCPECDAIVPMGAIACPECGHTFESRRGVVTYDDGAELVEVDPRRARHARADVDLRALAILGLELRELPSGGEPATSRQIDALRAAGLKAEWAKLGKRAATVLLDRIALRRERSLCTVKQAVALATRGLAHDVSFELAREALDAIAAAQWRTPEWLLRDARFRREAAA